MKIKTRSIKSVSPRILCFLAAALVLQVFFHHISSQNDSSISTLPPAPQAGHLKILSMGEQSALAKITLLWLQAFDSQGGIKLRYSELDYTRLTQWLDRIIELNSKSDYPMLLASQIYTMVPDTNKKRYALEYVYKKFLQRPEQNWRWLSQCAVIAKHQLNDFNLAVKYAQAIRKNAPGAPTWAKQMEVLLLDDIGEYETAEIILGGLISSKQFKDEKELIFLQDKLTEIKQRTVEK
ncbi:MAG: hypothetical protein D6B28_01865 [Gammaproteobacteria bacterium]|nr:MAG: hypothetical protein D6B28_01865 [Gammaproteobacteria bacterium]